MKALQHNRLRPFAVAGALAAVLAALSAAVAPAAAGELRVGLAAVKITPPPGTPLAGYYNASERGSRGVLDDLYAKAAVFDDGQTKLALVVCDLIGLPRPVVAEARRLIREKTGMAEENVMLSATHTHTGPALTGESSLDDLVIKGSELSRDYTRGLPKLIAQAVEEAHARRVPARISRASANEPKLAFNRRFWMKDGRVGWNPGKLNPNTIRPIGPVDPEVGVLYVEAADSKPLLTYVNFALHADTTGGMLISADYPGALSRRLAEWKGPQMLTLFANGACGNINHVNVNWADRQHGPEEASRIGTVLAAAAIHAQAELRPVENVALRVRSRTIELPLAPITDEDLRQAREIAARRDAKTPFLEQVKAYKVLDVAARKGKPIAAEVQVMTMGRDVAWVALPGEIFVELGLSIKAASRFPQTLVVELANGAVDYIPNRSAYAEGQYEVVSARCAAGSGEMLVTAAVSMLAELYREESSKR
jgi:hypothetical protein